MMTRREYLAWLGLACMCMFVCGALAMLALRMVIR